MASCAPYACQPASTRSPSVTNPGAWWRRCWNRKLPGSKGTSHFELASGRQRPVDRRFAAGFQVSIGLGEMGTAHEAAVGRQRRRMHAAQDQVTLAVDQLALLLRVAAP